jgi:hypothetical protein
VALAVSVLHCASLYLWLLVYLAEALFCHTVGWIGEFEAIAANCSVNCSRRVSKFLHFHEVNRYHIKWAISPPIVDGTLADALFILIGTMLDWWHWIIGWISLAEALFIMTISGVTIEGILIAKQLTIGKHRSPSSLHHFCERHVLARSLVCSLTVVYSTETVTELEAGIIGAVLRWRKWSWSQFSDTVALVSACRTRLIEGCRITGQVSSSTCSSIEDSNKIVMHSTEAIGLFSEMN